LQAGEGGVDVVDVEAEALGKLGPWIAVARLSALRSDFEVEPAEADDLFDDVGKRNVVEIDTSGGTDELDPNNAAILGVIDHPEIVELHGVFHVFVEERDVEHIGFFVVLSELLLAHCGSP
jgi:hypothetical protein